MSGAEPDGPAPAWQAVCASRRGSSHAAGVPNQDAVRCEEVTPRNRPGVWVAAVADGHGGARYVRSDVGARTAVDTAVDAVRSALEQQPETDPAELLRAEVPGIVTTWRDVVRRHAAAHPYTEDELLRIVGAPPDADDLTSYGATLLVAVVGEHGVAVAQVGDGDALVRSHGYATRPVPGDERLVAGETTSLCLESAVQDFRHWSLSPGGEADLVLLATDGYGNSFARTDWWHELLGDLASFVDRAGVEELEQQLPEWLEESAHVGGDDVSAVVLVRQPLAVAPAGPLITPAGAGVDAWPRTLDLPASGPTTSAPVPPGVGRGRLPVLATVAVLVVVACVVVVLLLLGPDVPDSPAITPLAPGPTDTTDVVPTGAPSSVPTDESGRRSGRKGGREETTPPVQGPRQEPPGRPGDGAAPGEDGALPDGS